MPDVGEPRLSAERPDEKRERRALSWLMDVQKNHDNRLYREFATTVIESLAWFEGREHVDRERAERLERELEAVKRMYPNVKDFLDARALSAASTPACEHNPGCDHRNALSVQEDE